MIVLILGTAVVAGAGMGWYGHKAGARIAAWGLKADEQDLIFQQMSEGESGGEIWLADKRPIEAGPTAATLGPIHYPATAAASK